MTEILFCDYKKLTQTQAENLLNIRNSDEVRLNNINTDVINISDHFMWLEKLEFEKYFAIIVDGLVIGAVCCPKDEWGLFFKTEINPVLKMLCVYLYLQRQFKKFTHINSVIRKNNTSAISLNKFFGFTQTHESENFYHFILKKEVFLNLNNPTIKLLNRNLKNTKITWH